MNIKQPGGYAMISGLPPGLPSKFLGRVVLCVRFFNEVEVRMVNGMFYAQRDVWLLDGPYPEFRRTHARGYDVVWPDACLADVSHHPIVHLSELQANHDDLRQFRLNRRIVR